MQQIVGIDLGMTYSCIAYVDNAGRAVTLKNDEGFCTTPSVVFFESPHNVVVGATAKAAMRLEPDKVVAFVKRNMGDPNTTYEVDGRTYRPEEVSSFVLKRLVKDASEFLNRPITDAVITVPAYFGMNQKKATEQAGKIAGLNVRLIINEPTAAAICYGVDQENDQVVLVYDLGGGTFDVTLIEVKERAINVVCTGGDHELGGRDWDDRIVNYLATCWGEQNGQPNYEVDDPFTANDLRLEAEKQKLQLTAREKLSAMLTIDGQRAKVDLTRDTFNELSADLLERTIELTREMLGEAAKKGVTDFARILLVGGSTRMPQVKDRLQQEFAKDIVMFDPDEAVAKGAAIVASRMNPSQTLGAAQVVTKAKTMPSKSSVYRPTENAEVTRKNFYILLDLDPSIQDWSTIEAAIRSKRSEWSRDASTSPSPKRQRQASQNMSLVPELERVMKDSELRDREAEQGRELLNSMRRDTMANLKEDLAFLCAKGFIWDDELGRLAKLYGRHVEVAEIQNLIPFEVRTPATGVDRTPPLDKTMLGRIRASLEAVNCSDLYAFLGKDEQRGVGCEVLIAEANKKAEELRKEITRTTEFAARTELIGLAKSIFVSDEKRRQYDLSLADMALDKVHAKFDLISGDTVYLQTFQQLMRIGAEAGATASQTRACIRDLAKRRGMLVEVPALHQ